MANNLKRLREAKGWSQDEAAAAVETTRNQYGKLERSERGLTLEWIERVVKAYGVDPGVVVTDLPIPDPVGSLRY